MAKELTFKLADKEYSAAPVKLERKKIYGWTDTVATDRNGDICQSAYLSTDEVLIIPSGGLKQATVSEDGKWLDKNELTAYSENGEDILPILPSAFDAPIVLSDKATLDEFLDNDWESIYQIDNEELSAIIGDDIFKFEFSYRGGTNHNDGYLLSTPSGLFLFAGDRQDFALVGLTEETVIDEIDEPDDESIDDLDFSMF